MAIDFTKNYPVIEWDLNRSFFRIEKYFGKKEENSRGFKIQILQDSEILIPTTETLRIYCKKPDNTKVYIDASAIEDTYFVINLTNQVFAIPGIVECELQLNSNSKWRYSPTFGIDVSDNLVDGSIISSDDFIALQNALASIDNKIDWSKVVNNTVTASSGFILDGRVGKTLQDQITTINDNLAVKTISLTAQPALTTQARTRAYASGKTVTISGFINNTGTSQAAIYLIDDPAYHPSDECYGTGMIIDANGTVCAGNVFVVLKNNGYIYVAAQNMAQAFIVFFITYTLA